MAIYYISSGHKDGLGGNMRHLIKAHIYAKDNGYEFINYNNHFIKHSVPFYKTFSIFSNLKKIRDIPDKSTIIVFGDYHKDEVIEYIKKEYEYKKFNYKEIDNNIYDKIVRLNFQKDIRQIHQHQFHKRNDKSPNNLCKAKHINIVLHIRRGDVLRKIQDKSRMDYRKRLTPDDEYFRILKKILPLLPKNHHIILFSEGFEEEFKEYKTRFPRTQLCVDDERWRYIIDEEQINHKDYDKAVNRMNNLIITCCKADIFIGANSHLSHVLAYLNKNISFFPNYFYENFDDLNNIYKFDEFENASSVILDYVVKKS